MKCGSIAILSICLVAFYLYDWAWVYTTFFCLSYHILFERVFFSSIFVYCWGVSIFCNMYASSRVILFSSLIIIVYFFIIDIYITWMDKCVCKLLYKYFHKNFRSNLTNISDEFLQMEFIFILIEILYVTYLWIFWFEAKKECRRCK